MPYFGQSKPDGCENMGTPWREPEVAQLLEEVKLGQTHEQIAKAHKRTPGGIISYLKVIAYQNHKNEMPMSEIITLTGISKNDIIDYIIKKEAYDELKEKRKEQKKAVLPISENKSQNTSKPQTSQSAEIAELKNEVLSLKNDVKEILRLMNALYDFESQ